MSRFTDVFGNDKVFLPVIHVKTRRQVLENVHIAKTEGADGVFLIQHGHPSFMVLSAVYEEVRTRYPRFWVGINFLDRDAAAAVETVPTTASGLWVDNAGFDGTTAGTPDAPDLIAEQLRRRRHLGTWSGLYFGGVAFKYQEQVADPGRAAQQAVLHGVDVVTTSGDATGSPPTIEKVRAIRDAVGADQPVANASGMTPENVGPFVPLLDCFLVASSIAPDFYNFDPDVVHAFKRAISK